MRILRVAQKVYPEHTGGGAYHVHAMSRDQADMGHDVTVLTVGDGPRREERDGYRVVRCPAMFSALGNDVAPGVWRYLRDAEEYDVVHAHSHLYFSTNLAALRRRFSETPLAITNHGLYSQSVPKGLFDAYLRTLGCWTFNRADVVLTYTNIERRRLESIGVDTDIAVIPNGIDGNRFTPDTRPAERLRATAPVILFVGRLVEGKRPMDAIRAIRHIGKRCPDVRLFLAGDGPLRKELEVEASRLNVRDQVEFLGHVSYDEMPSVYTAADVFVLPSRTEGFPRTLLEALASGVPVVTTNLKQFQHITDEAGRTVPLSNVDALGEALTELLTDERLRIDLGERGRRLVVEEFTWDHTVERTTAVLTELL